MTIEIDGEQALALLEQAVAERGADYTYQSEFGGDGVCQYQVGGKPACLVGVALHKAGVDVTTLYAFDIGSFESAGVEYETGGTAITELSAECWTDEETDLPSPLSLFEIVLSKEALKIFSEAQKAQDGGYTWGMALDAARKVA